MRRRIVTLRPAGGGDAPSLHTSTWPSTSSVSACYFSVDRLTNFGLDRFRPWLHSQRAGKSFAERGAKMSQSETSTVHSPAPVNGFIHWCFILGRAQKVIRDRKRSTGHQLIAHKTAFPSSFQCRKSQQICACAYVCTLASTHIDIFLK